MAVPHSWNVYLEDKDPERDGHYIGTVEAYTVRGALRYAAEKYNQDINTLDVIMTDIDHSHHNTRIGETDHDDTHINDPPIQP